MFVLNFIMLVKGVGIILWVYKGSGDFFVCLGVGFRVGCVDGVLDLFGGG
ncbi:hypothetical protein ACOIC8_27290 [Klebsiella pneumoniae]